VWANSQAPGRARSRSGLVFSDVSDVSDGDDRASRARRTRAIATRGSRRTRAHLANARNAVLERAAPRARRRARANDARGCG
jgi:hypothetical protein